ncbi:uncharacterized protein EI90DRAFT_3013671 [Cantharellus anzutake]|uniref:uncharacterized protein n=1 Tax=Cantharellus anzutake TaxID=1750568 RepID=UPI001907BDB7|nr:uncharacterized protein EI90DRAFT_3013671 [Cantharellus anzutake]KAF8337456.1 hypothetical protein EI90DRAFT_3013671 [Cantharellus anzutake]
MSSIIVSPEQEAAIVSACREHERQHKWEKNYRRCVVTEDFFVKFGSYNSIYPQYMTQKYISQLAAMNPDAPHIPEVYHFFTEYLTPDYRMAYLVMERLELTPISDQDLSPRVSRALQWLYSLPAPAEAAIGGLGGGRARHVLFKDRRAPLDFSSIEALERYMNKARRFVIARMQIRFHTLDPINIKHESLVFTQSDMDVSNFGVDKDGKTCLFDFETVGLLPQSFVTYTMSPADGSFAAKVAGHLNLPLSPNIPSMGKISELLWILSDPKLGLDNSGMPKRKR